MIYEKDLTEQEFLKKLSVALYNVQYNKRINFIETTIVSIPPRSGTTHGYEIATTRPDDFVKLRLYFAFGKDTQFSKYRVEVAGPQHIGTLGDEVFVCSGRLDKYYLDSGVYKFRWIGPSDSNLLSFISEDNLYMFVSEDDSRYFAQEAAY